MGYLKQALLCTAWLLGGSFVYGLTLESSAFVDGGELPAMYAAADSETSPPVNWDGAPRRTKTYAIVADRLGSQGEAVVHWVIYNIPVRDSHIAEGAYVVFNGSTREAQTGLNSWAKAAWTGPDAAKGSGELRIRLFALDRKLTFQTQPDAVALFEAMDGYVLDVAEIVAVSANES
ncbi:MAG: YbhB/YbcL family Raf kinase inhibitor-like protein [Verrucomicrobiota bacterium]